MIANPEKLIFETKEDLIDYVSLGLPPSEKRFNTLIEMLDAAVTVQTESLDEQYKAEHIAIDFSKINLGQNELHDILTQVYHNQQKNRDTMIIVCAVTFITGIAIGSMI